LRELAIPPSDTPRRLDPSTEKENTMATKSAFTPGEWETLQFAMTDTMAWLSVVDPGFWALMKEAGHAGRFVAEQASDAPNLLVRDLAHDVYAKRDDTLVSSPGNVELPTLARVDAASRLVAEKAPEDLEAFKSFIIGIAEAVAEASNGVSGAEAGAIAKLERALE
jgi:hypothetical protein